MTEETLFQMALEQAAAERVAFLERACADEELRRRVVELLHAADNPDNFLGQPPQLATTADDPCRAMTLGSRIGKYQLLEPIGKGGMGAVFLAQQTGPLRRQVALKFIKSGLDSREVVARFEAERQALALMDHPNIAQIYDAGATDAGQPYFVMELVKGVPLTQYCDERRLTVRQRLELFLPVCQAVQHAHSKGIIHRDLKPSNVLVAEADGKPVPKVIDFGLVKATGQPLTDKTLYTACGMALGTLDYMSPEQAGRNHQDIDTRADVYALGGFLYELLTGTTPLGKQRLQEAWQADWLECLRLVREEEPPRPSTRLSTTEELPSIAGKRGVEPRKLSGLVRGDLDWIVMKCLEKDRERRYKTADGLAQDVQRYLADEPVLASPPSALRRLRKFARSHKAGLSVAVVVVLVLAVGAGWATWEREIRRADLGRRRTETGRVVNFALGRAEQLGEQAAAMPSATSRESDTALAVWHRAEDALAEGEAALTAGVADDALRERLYSLRRQLEQGQHQAQKRRDQAVRKEKLFHDLEEASMVRLAVVNGGLDFAGSARRYRAVFSEFGLDVSEVSAEEGAHWIAAQEADIRDALLVALHDWIICATLTQTTSSVLNLWVLVEEIDHDSWRKGLWAAAAAQDCAALRSLSAEARQLSLPTSSLVLAAWLLLAYGEHDEALALLHWARSRRPSDFRLNYELGTMLLGKKARTALELEEAIGCFVAAVALRPTVSALYAALGTGLLVKHQMDDALTAFRKAIDLDPQSAYAYGNLGCILLWNRRLDDAIVAFRKVICLEPDCAVAYSWMAIALLEKGQLAAARDAFKQAHALGSQRGAKMLYPSGKALERAERLVLLEARLPALLKGNEIPANNQEKFDVADVCRLTQRYASASRFYVQLLNDDVRTVDESEFINLCCAACCAAQAAAGNGTDADTLGNEDRTRLRKQALDWLRAGLALVAEGAASNKYAESEEVKQVLKRWQDDTNLASVRDPEILKKLPADEQAAWHQLWADVAELLKKAGDAK